MQVVIVVDARTEPFYFQIQKLFFFRALAKIKKEKIEYNASGIKEAPVN